MAVIFSSVGNPGLPDLRLSEWTHSTVNELLHTAFRRPDPSLSHAQRADLAADILEEGLGDASHISAPLTPRARRVHASYVALMADTGVSLYLPDPHEPVVVKAAEVRRIAEWFRSSKGFSIQIFPEPALPGLF